MPPRVLEIVIGDPRAPQVGSNIVDMGSRVDTGIVVG